MITQPRRSANALDERTPPGAMPGYKWLAMCVLLLGVTWMPLLGVHAYRMSLGAASTGPVLVVFPPTLRSDELFQNVIESNGSLVRPIGWFRNAWVVQSVEPGFAGRLKERGAWGVYSLDLLSADALFNCLRISSTSPSGS